MAVKNAAKLLDGFCADGIAIEVTHRSKRRLFGLAALAPLRDEVAPPRRPEHGRGRGRPPVHPAEEAITEPLICPPPLTPLERRTFDYSGLGAALALVDEAMSNIRRTLADGALGVDAIRAGQAGDGDPERAQLAGGQLEREEWSIIAPPGESRGRRRPATNELRFLRRGAAGKARLTSGLSTKIHTRSM